MSIVFSLLSDTLISERVELQSAYKEEFCGVSKNYLKEMNVYINFLSVT